MRRLYLFEVAWKRLFVRSFPSPFVSVLPLYSPAPFVFLWVLPENTGNFPKFWPLLATDLDGVGGAGKTESPLLAFSATKLLF